MEILQLWNSHRDFYNKTFRIPEVLQQTIHTRLYVTMEEELNSEKLIFGKKKIKVLSDKETRHVFILIYFLNISSSLYSKICAMSSEIADFIGIPCIHDFENIIKVTYAIIGEFYDYQCNCL